MIGNDITDMVFCALVEALFIVVCVLGQFRQNPHYVDIKLLLLGFEAYFLVYLIDLAIFIGKFSAELRVPHTGVDLQIDQIVLELLDQAFVPCVFELVIFV